MISRTSASIALFAALTLHPTRALAQNGDWSLQPTQVSPSERTHSAMAYDPVRQRTVMFHGFHGAPQTFFADTWEWNGATWQEIPTPVHPNGRAGHAMAFDPVGQRVILFGGWDGSSSLDDTWAWDGQSWTQLTSPASPSGRRDLQMTSAIGSTGLLLFGGTEATSGGALGTPRSDTWRWDGSQWTELFPVNEPVSRARHTMALDQAGQRILLFGGRGAGGLLGDTWQWNGANWSLLIPPTAPSPSAREHSRMACDPTTGIAVLFGGWDGQFLGDTWAWDSVAWTSPTTSAQPSVRSGESLAWHEASGHFVLFGGFGHLPGQSESYFDETWIWQRDVAFASTYGVGCGSPSLGLVPDPAARPIIGQVGRATIVNAPTLAAGVSMGFQDDTFLGAPLPVSLSVLGMTGCQLWHSADVLGLPVAPFSSTSLLFSYLIPSNPSLSGASVFLQAYVLAPGANPLQIVVSNGLEWRLGTH